MIAIQINIKTLIQILRTEGIAIFTDFLGVEALAAIQHSLFCLCGIVLRTEQHQNLRFPGGFLPLVPLVSFFCLFATPLKQPPRFSFFPIFSYSHISCLLFSSYSHLSHSFCFLKTPLTAELPDVLKSHSAASQGRTCCGLPSADVLGGQPGGNRAHKRPVHQGHHGVWDCVHGLGSSWISSAWE